MNLAWDQKRNSNNDECSLKGRDSKSNKMNQQYEQPVSTYANTIHRINNKSIEDVFVTPSLPSFPSIFSLKSERSYNFAISSEDKTKKDYILDNAKKKNNNDTTDFIGDKNVMLRENSKSHQMLDSEIWNVRQNQSESFLTKKTNSPNRNMKHPKLSQPPKKRKIDVAAIKTEIIPNEEITENDVLCGRGAGIAKHIGNKKFREIVQANQQTYVNAKLYHKVSIASKIVDSIQSKIPPGRFLKKITDNDPSNGWLEIPKTQAREKTSQALREKEKSGKSSTTLKPYLSAASNITSVGCRSLNEVDLLAVAEASTKSKKLYRDESLMKNKNGENDSRINPACMYKDEMNAQTRPLDTFSSSALAPPPQQNVKLELKQNFSSKSSSLLVPISSSCQSSENSSSNNTVPALCISGTKSEVSKKSFPKQKQKYPLLISRNTTSDAVEKDLKTTAKPSHSVLFYRHPIFNSSQQLESLENDLRYTASWGQHLPMTQNFLSNSNLASLSLGTTVEKNLQSTLPEKKSIKTRAASDRSLIQSEIQGSIQPRFSQISCTTSQEPKKSSSDKSQATPGLSCSIPTKLSKYHKSNPISEISQLITDSSLRPRKKSAVAQKSQSSSQQNLQTAPVLHHVHPVIIRTTEAQKKEVAQKQHSKLDSSSDSHVTVNDEETIEPGQNDVLYGRGAGINSHIGNQKFRALVKHHQKQYLESPKLLKGDIAKSIVVTIQNSTPPGRFLSQNPVTSKWEEVEKSKACEKTSQALREKAPAMRKGMAAYSQKQQQRRESTNFVYKVDSTNIVQQVNDEKKYVPSEKIDNHHHNFVEKKKSTKKGFKIPKLPANYLPITRENICKNDTIEKQNEKADLNFSP